jgi:N-acetylglucosaminyldiphosphoundecaprenol N-acetyl-beta-D-mannosaminyltransferase
MMDKPTAPPTDIRLMGYTVSTRLEGILAPGRPDSHPARPLIVNTLNPHAYCTAKKDPLFSRSLKESDILLPDGSGIVLAAALLKGKKIRKIAGADLHDYLLKRLNQIRGSCFYLGASQKTRDLIKARLATEFPNIRAGFFSPPYKHEFSEEENKLMIAAINNELINSATQQINKSTNQQFNHPPLDVLFVGMTAPKQEKWAFANRDQLNARMICSIGAVFDFYAGTVKRSSPFWISIGLEWLPRLLREPGRLYKRVFISGPEFLFDLFLYLFRIKKA